ncbi:hypothetical protein QUG63_29060, partial [Klebsiella michiganensis]
NPFACELIFLQKHAFACLTYPEFKKIPIRCLWFFFEKSGKNFFITVTLNNSAVADFTGRLMRWGLIPL